MRRDVVGRVGQAGLLALAMSGLLSACQEPKANTSEREVPARPVLVATVVYKERQPERAFVGTIRPRIETDLGFRVAGKVATRLINVGELVRAGQPLATLDEVDLQLQTEQAEAELRAGRRACSRPRPS
jgi:multidrug efflux pump subunit AcrA (membrane-fusion protein)